MDKMPSDFVIALGDLIGFEPEDTSKIFTHKEWAKILGVATNTIEMWLSDRAIPRCFHLLMLHTTLTHSSDVDQASLERFNSMAQQPAREVSEKFGSLMLPTVWEYMKRPVFSEVSSKLAKLNIKQQAAYLEKLYPK